MQQDILNKYFHFITTYSIFFRFVRKKAPEEILGSLDFTVFLLNYSIIVATLPDPTVLPPSLMKGFVIVITNHCKMRVSIFLILQNR